MFDRCAVSLDQVRGLSVGYRPAVKVLPQFGALVAILLNIGRWPSGRTQPTKSDLRKPGVRSN